MPAAPTNAAPVVVIGGGISGLACALRLKQLGVPFLLLEAFASFGGVIHTVRQDGFLFEFGPQGVLLTPELTTLIDAAGLSGDLLRANPRAPRYIYTRGRLVRAPMSPPSLISSSLLSIPTKLRLLTEPLRRSRPPEEDESVAAFVRRKFGSSLLDNLVGPFVSGIYAGDPEKLSLRAAFPQVHKWESSSGSVLRGAINQMKRKPKGSASNSGLHTFKEGIGSLLTAAGEKLGASAQLGVTVHAIEGGAVGPNCYTIRLTRNATHESLQACAVIVATETSAAGRMLRSLSPKFPTILDSIAYAAVAVIAAGYRRAAVGHSLDGFGFLVPRKEGLRTLGTVWNSSLFPGRAPEGHVVLTTFAGGVTDPEIPTWSEDKISATIHEELGRILNITESPAVSRVYKYPRALPQYNLGHMRTVAALENLCGETPGLYLAGNYLEGPSTGACVTRSFRIAEQVRSALGVGRGGKQ
jgi:oxygen-dependent protoporphyrinogen oxidase